MADDYEFQVDRSITPREREMIAGNARWAETFGPGETNLAQRQRYQEAISEERGRRNLEKEQAFNQSLLNKDARDLYFKGRAADLAQARATHEMDLRQQKFQMDQELFPKRMENERLKLQVQQSNLERMTNKEARDAANALRVDQQSEGFENDIQTMLDNNVNPHSPQFAEGLARAYAKNPHAEKGIVGQWFKNSGIEMSPEDFQRFKTTVGDNMDVSVTAGPKGYTFSARPKRELQPKIDTTVQQDERMLDALKAKSKDPKYEGDEDFQSYIKGRIQTIQDRLDRRGGSGTTVGSNVADIGTKGNAAAEAAVSAGIPAQGTGIPQESPQNLSFDNDPSGFEAAFKASKPGAVLIYNGKKYTKPQ